MLVPQDWIVEEISPNDPLLGGHLINLHPSVSIHGENIRITFKQTGEETLLWPTGVGQGEYIPTGTLEIDGEPALRYQLVCPSGETTSIWYHQTEGLPAITRGGLEFSFIFHASSFHCEPGLTLDGEKQLLGEKIISSLSVEWPFHKYVPGLL